MILTEDASKYNLDNRSERNDPGPIVSGSRQIYLTFPAESTFTEEDVSNYFGYVFLLACVLIFIVRMDCCSNILLLFLIVALLEPLKMLGSHANKSGCLDS